MDTVLFNFHDLVLILTGFECLLLALLLGATYKKENLSTLFFIGFLLCHTLIPLHEVTFWGTQFRHWVLSISPNLFFVGSYSYFLDGPLLYFFIRALLYKDFALRRVDAIHLAPVALYFLLLIFTFYILDYDTRHELIETQHIAYSSPYLYFDFISKYFRVAYAIACLMLIFNYSERLKDVFAEVNAKDIAWLKLMVLSFLLLFGWDAMLLSMKMHGLWVAEGFAMDALNIVGVAAYHLNFIVLNVLVFLKFTRFAHVETVDEHRSIEVTDNTNKFNPVYLERIENGMKDANVFTMPGITVDKLAKALDVPSKKLSQIIKLHYQLNFYEFVNSYRVEEAKLMLCSPENLDKTITEIYLEVGFNSKSVFNTFFKRMVGMTPSQYREQNQGKTADKPNLFELKSR